VCVCVYVCVYICIFVCVLVSVHICDISAMSFLKYLFGKVSYQCKLLIICITGNGFLLFIFVVTMTNTLKLYDIITGEKVNIEVDVLAKMVERSLKGVYESNSSGSSASNDAAVAALTAKVSSLEAAIQSMQLSLSELLKAK
jgi:hypothetical protein